MQQEDNILFDSQKLSNWGIHWFRRDLKVVGNPALLWNLKKHEGRVVGIFCFDSQFLSRPDFSHHRFAFFIKTLIALKKELQELGSDLLVLDQHPEKAFLTFFNQFKKENLSHDFSMTWNRDYEPYARQRDEKIEKILLDLKIPFHNERDHLLLEPHEVINPNSEKFYQIFTPFSKRWFEKFHSHEVKDRIRGQKSGLEDLEDRLEGKTKNLRIQKFSLTWKQVFSNFKKPIQGFEDCLEEFQRKNNKHVTISIPEGGSLMAYKALKEFKNKIDDYEVARNIPSINGTSHFSIYLKNGSLTSSQIIQFLKLEKMIWKDASSQNKFLKEIVWREFYYCILFHRPDVENSSFKLHFKNLPWENREDYFNAWKEGKTGFPIVDAGMRQLNQTGWMHNRVRMIVASFLTKDLLIDWKWGEQYFMEQLLDGDLASNNGGWQWAASTGCDAQPFFRIFNPILQSQKFDPKGEYIRKYLPELKNVSSKEIHFPRKPIVDHATQKMKALKMYREFSLKKK